MRKWLSGRASPCQGEGREFESRLPLHLKPESKDSGFFYLRKAGCFMNTLEAIHARKTIRSYKSQMVEREKLEAVVYAGNQAAIAGKLEFVVISNREVLDAIQKEAKNFFRNSGIEKLVNLASNPNYEVLHNAPAGIAVIIDVTNDPHAMKMNAENTGCAVQNMLVAATELGLGSCFAESASVAFMGPNLKKAIGISEDKTVSAIVALGYSENLTSAVKRSTSNITWCE